MSLASRRLAVVDLETGQQPQANENRSIWSVCNGEIYNHAGIRAMLEERGHRFHSDHSDTETIVHLYEQYGDLWPILGAANGMFAVAIWDAKRRRLLLYRDRIGKKPLYYCRSGNQLIFASEIKALLVHARISREPDFRALFHYFSLKHISAPRTAYRDIRQVQPGHCLVWENGTLRTTCYWRPQFGETLEDIGPEEAASELGTLLEDAVRLRLNSDVPLGAFLSGGVDSGAVAALMRRQASTRIKTFCLAYRDEPRGRFRGKAEDRRHAAQLAGMWSTEHREHLLDAQEFAQGMPRVMGAFDEPFSGAVSTYFISSLIQRHVKVALTGDGADELFGSYLAHRLARPMARLLVYREQGLFGWDQLDAAQRSALRPFDTPKQFAFLSSLADARQARWRMGLAVFDDDQKRKVLSPDFLDAASGASSCELYAALESSGTARDPVNAALEIDQRELLPNQVLPFMDRLSMAHSLELRSPFLDYRIIEFANRLPGRLKIRDGQVKYVHKLAVAHLLPPEVLRRPKEGFVQPVYDWLAGELHPWMEAILSPERAGRSGMLNPGAVGRLVAAFPGGGERMAAQVWNLVCFQLWWEGANGGG